LSKSKVVKNTTKNLIIYSVSPFAISLFIALLFNQKPETSNPEPTVDEKTNIELMDEKILQTDIESIKESLSIKPSNIFLQELQTSIVDQVNSLSKGTMGVYYKNLRTEETVEINSNESFPPASTFKVFTALLTLLSIEKNEFTLNNSVTLSQSLYVPYGSVYTRANIGSSFTISKILYNMIAGSCNTAQSMLFAQLKRDNIETRLSSDLGLKATSLKDFKTTPYEMANTFERLYEGNILTEEHRQLLIGLMNKSSTTDRIRAGLPKGTLVANKGGTLTGSKHDIAIVSSPNGDYILAIYTKDVNESEAVSKIVDISKIVWEANDNI